MSKKPFTWSYTSLNVFEMCPRKWEAQYVFRRKEPETPQMIEGKVVHAYMAKRASGTPLPPHLKDLEKWGAAIDAAKAIGWTVMPEQQIGLTRGMTQTGWFDPDVNLRVIMDLALVGPRDAIVVDYKTGKQKYHDATQLQLFAGAGFALWPDVVTIHTKYLWTQTGQQNSETYTRQESAARIWTPILARVAEMEHAVEVGSFPPKPSWACAGCLAYECPHRKEKKNA